MRVLVTGGGGFIGSTLVPVLLSAGHQVIVVDHFLHKQNSLAMVCGDPDFDVVRGDVRDRDLMRGLLAKADVIIPLAALVGAPQCDADPFAAVTTNVEAIKLLCTDARDDQWIIAPISNSGYGVGEPGIECTEETPMRPVSLYGRSKVEAEKLILARKNSVSLRLATVFGMSPRMRVDLLLNEFVWRAMTDRSIVLFEPDYMRNFCHIRDVANAFVHTISNFDKMSEQKVFNVGDSRANMSKRQLCERIKAYLSDFEVMEAKIGTDPDKRDYLVSNARIEATGWKAYYSIDDGINELIKGYQAMPKFYWGNV
jgi:nucleoside-diphosphate-sugar epimerase